LQYFFNIGYSKTNIKEIGQIREDISISLISSSVTLPAYRLKTKQEVEHHFADASKMIELGKGGQRDSPPMYINIASYIIF